MSFWPVAASSQHLWSMVAFGAIQIPHVTLFMLWLFTCSLMFCLHCHSLGLGMNSIKLLDFCFICSPVSSFSSTSSSKLSLSMPSEFSSGCPSSRKKKHILQKVQVFIFKIVIQYLFNISTNWLPLKLLVLIYFLPWNLVLWHPMPTPWWLSFLVSQTLYWSDPSQSSSCYIIFTAIISNFIIDLPALLCTF